MNKYQEALDDLTTIAWEYTKVDNDDETGGRCRHQTVAIGNRKLSYCGNCGVKIDWSV